MPKLNAKVAKAVDAADAAQSGFTALPPGQYAAQLRSVEEKEGKEYPYWVWEFHNLHDTDGERQPGRQWHNTSTSPKSVAFMKAVFEAFGYTADSDTDEMIGEWVVLTVDQEVQSVGANAGRLRNKITAFGEFDPDDWDFDPDAFEATGEPAAKGRAKV